MVLWLLELVVFVEVLDMVFSIYKDWFIIMSNICLWIIYF